MFGRRTRTGQRTKAWAGAMDTRHGRARWLQTDGEALRTEHYEPVKTLSHYLALVYMHSGRNGYKGGPLAPGRDKGGAMVMKRYEANIASW